MHFQSLLRWCRCTTRKDVLIQWEYVQGLLDKCKEALLLSDQANNVSNEMSTKAILPPVERATPGNRSWAAFAMYNDVLAEHVANVATKRWKDRLAGTDVFAISHAQRMLESAMVDWDTRGPFSVAN
jgi:hypothetical protein